MKKNYILIILVFAALLVLAFFMAMWKQFNWEKTFKYDKQSPYDSKLIYELLLDSRKGKNNHVIFENNDHTLQTRIEKSNYIFIGQNLYLDSAEQSNLLHFVERGNTAFISAEHLPEFLDRLLLPEELYSGNNDEYEDEDSAYSDTASKSATTYDSSGTNDTTYTEVSKVQSSNDTSITITSGSDTFTLKLNDSTFAAQIDTTKLTDTDTTIEEEADQEYPTSYIRSFYDSVTVSFAIDSTGKKESCITPILMQDFYITAKWSYFDTSANHPYSIDENAKLLGYQKYQHFNFVSVPYGDGIFYLHLTPLTFANHTLAKEENLAYSETVFSYLNDGPIIWDEYAKSYRFLDENAQSEAGENNPFRYVLSQDSLRWAWYALLALILLYFIFIGKRKQRVIPVIEPTRNTSLEFVKTVGQLYYIERNHRAICLHKMKLFHLFLRHRYAMNAIIFDQEYIDRLALISGVHRQIIQRIYSAYTIIEKDITLTDKEFIDFHQDITHFYKECK